MPEYELVHVLGGRQGQNRALAKGLQRVPSAQRYFIPDTDREFARKSGSEGRLNIVFSHSVWTTIWGTPQFRFENAELKMERDMLKKGSGLLCEAPEVKHRFIFYFMHSKFYRNLGTITFQKNKTLTDETESVPSAQRSSLLISIEFFCFLHHAPKHPLKMP